MNDYDEDETNYDAIDQCANCERITQVHFMTALCKKCHAALVDVDEEE